MSTDLPFLDADIPNLTRAWRIALGDYVSRHCSPTPIQSALAW